MHASEIAFGDIIQKASIYAKNCMLLENQSGDGDTIYYGVHSPFVQTNAASKKMQ